MLDFEDNPKSNMSIHQAVQFLRLLEQKTGRKGAIYSGNRLKETIGQLNSTDRAGLPVLAPALAVPVRTAGGPVWQFTGDGIGPQPHSVPGIAGAGIDLNAYDGDKAKLTAEWAPGGSALADFVTSVSPTRSDAPSSHARQAEADDVDNADSDQPAPVPAVQTSAYSLDVEILQRKLDRLGYHDVGDMDGKWGGKTKGAIVAFLNDRHISAGEITGITRSLPMPSPLRWRKAGRARSLRSAPPPPPRISRPRSRPSGRVYGSGWWPRSPVRAPAASRSSRASAVSSAP